MNINLTFNTPKKVASQPQPPYIPSARSARSAPHERFHASSVLAMSQNYEAKISGRINRTVTPILAKPILCLYNEKYHVGTPYEFVSKLALLNKNLSKMQKNKDYHECTNSSHLSSLEKHRHEVPLSIDYGCDKSIEVISIDFSSDSSSCRVPHDDTPSESSPLLFAQEILKELIASLQDTQE